MSQSTTKIEKLLSIVLVVCLLFTSMPQGIWEMVSADTITSYDLYIGAGNGKTPVQVTSANSGDVLKDGTVSYDPVQGILTLTNATLQAYYAGYNSSATSMQYAAIYSGFDLKIVLNGNNTIKNSRNGIHSTGNVDINGYGSLKVQSDYRGITCNSFGLGEGANVEVDVAAITSGANSSRVALELKSSDSQMWLNSKSVKLKLYAAATLYQGNTYVGYAIKSTNANYFPSSSSMPSQLHKEFIYTIKSSKNEKGTDYTYDEFKAYSKTLEYLEIEHNHTWEDKKDGNSHWEECSGCHATQNMASHSYEYCTSTVCECGYERTQTDAHKYTLSVNDNYTEWTLACANCPDFQNGKLSVTGGNLVYTGAAQTAPVTCTVDAEGATVTYSLEESGTFTADIPKVTQSKVHTVYCKIELKGTTCIVPVNVSVGKAHLTVKPNDITIYRGEVLPEVTFTVDGVLNNDELPEFVATLDKFDSIHAQGETELMVNYNGTNVSELENYYVTYEDTLTVYVNDNTIESTDYIVNPDGKWSNQAFIVTPSGEEYTSVSLDGNNWSEKVTLDTPSSTISGTEATVYFQKDNGLVAITTITYFSDKTVPSVTLLVDDGHVYTNTDDASEKVYYKNYPSIIKAEAVDNLSGLSKLDYYIVQNDAVAYSQNPASWDESVWSAYDSEIGIVIATECKDCIVFVRATDKAGNVSYAHSARLIIDNEKPILSFDTSQVSSWTKEDLKLKVSALDELSGVKQVFFGTSLSQEGEISDSQQCVWEDGYYVFEAKTESADSSYWVVAYDNVGNKSEPVKIDVKIDTTAPAVETLKVDPSEWTNGKITLGGTVKDEASGIHFVYYAKGKYTAKQIAAGEAEVLETITIAQSDQLSAEFSFEISKQDYKGAYTVWTKDYAGNMSGVKTVDVQMDITAPMVETLKVDPSVWTNGKVMLSGTTKDEASGVKYIYYAKGIYTAEQIAAGEAKALETSTITQSDQLSAAFSFEIGEQDYKGAYTVWTKDYAGNVSDVKTIDVQMDVISPTVETIEVDHPEWTNGKVTLGGTVKDEASGIHFIYYAKGSYTAEQIAAGEASVLEKATISTPDQLSAEYSFVINAQNYEGAYTVWTSDYAGNVSDVKTVDVQMDITAPMVEAEFEENPFYVILETLTFGFFKSEAKIVIEAEDDASGIIGIYYTLGDDQEEIVVENDRAEIEIVAPYNGSLTMWAKDSAGNVCEQTVIVYDADRNTIENIVVDDTAPLVSVDSAIFDASVKHVANDVGISLKVNETNFYPQNIKITATCDGEETSDFTLSEWTKNDVGEYENTVMLTGEGEYILCIDYIDYSGNTALYTVNGVQYASAEGKYQSEKITIDRTAPKVTINYLDKDTENSDQLQYMLDDKGVATFKEADRMLCESKDLQIKISVLEQNFDSENVKMMLEELSCESDWVFDEESDQWVTVINCEGIETGQYCFRFTYTDKAGNKANITADDQSSASGEYSSKPIFFGYRPGDDDYTLSVSTKEWTNGEIVLTAKFQNRTKYKNASSIKAYVNGVEYDFSDKNISNLTWKATVEIDANTSFNGNVEIKYVTRNNYSHTQSTAVKMDKIVPTVETIEVDHPEWTNDKVTLSGTVKDDASGIHFVYYAKGKYTAKQIVAGEAKVLDTAKIESPDQLSAEYSFVIDEQDYKGAYTVWTEDYAGNVSNVKTVDVQMDVTAPTVETIEVDHPEWFKGDVTLRGVVKDDASGIHFVYYAKGGYTAEQIAAGEAKVLETSTITQLTQLEAEYAFLIKAQDYKGAYTVWTEDYAGNVSDVKTVDVQMDVTTPTVETIEVDHPEWINGKVTLSGTVKDDASGIHFVYYAKGKYTAKQIAAGEAKVLDTAKIESPDQLSAEYSFVINKQDYKGAYTVWTEDYAGNVSDVKTVDVQMDVTAPTVETIEVDQPEWTNGKVTLSGTVKDEASGIHFVYYAKGKYTAKQIAAGEAKVLDTAKIESSDQLSAEYSFVIDEQDYKGAYTVWTEDYAGNVSDVKTIEVQMDVTAPTVETIEVDHPEWANGKVTLSGTVKDDASGIHFVYYAKGGYTAEQIAAGEAKVLETSTITQSTQLEGEYAFLIKAQDYKGAYTVWTEDYAGNVSDVKTVDVQMDVTAPTVETIEVDHPEWTNGKVTLSGTVKDEASGIHFVYYAKGGYTAEQIAAGKANVLETTAISSPDQLFAEYSFVINKQDYKGAYTVWTEDYAGNVSDVKTVDMQMDVTAPTVETIEVDHPEWTNGKVTLSGTVKDEASGIKYIYYAKGRFTAKQIAAGDVTALETDAVMQPDQLFAEYSFVIDEQDYKGAYTVWTEDYAGNVSDVKTVDVQMDVTAPTVETIEVDHPEWINGKVTLSGTVKDEASGIHFVYYAKGGYAAEQIAAGEANVLETATISVPDQLFAEYSFVIDEQDYKGAYTVWTEDYAGNVSDVKTIEVQMDVTAPTVETIEVDHPEWTNGKVTLSGTVKDEASGIHFVYYAKGGYTAEQIASGEAKVLDTAKIESPEQLSAEYSFVIDEQDYKGAYTVWTEDYAGNVSEVKTVDVQMDVTAPTVETIEVDHPEWTNGKVTLSGTVKDEASGIHFVYYAKGGYTAEQIATGEANVLETATISNPGQLSADYSFVIDEQDYKGAYTVWTEDHAGNVSDVKTIEVQMDVTVPHIETAVASPNDWTKEDVDISGTVIDQLGDDQNAISEVVEVRYAKGDDVLAEGYKTATFDESQKTFNFTVESQNYEGNYVMWCVDAAGNLSDATLVGEKMDVTAPTVETIEVDHQEWTNGDVTIKGTVKDTETDKVVSGIKYIRCAKGDIPENVITAGEVVVLDESEVTSEKTQTGNYAFTIKRQDYKGVYTVWCVDYAGGISKPKTIEVQMDVTAPTVETIEVDHPEWINGKVTLSGTVKDEASGIHFVYYAKGGYTAEQIAAGEANVLETATISVPDQLSAEYSFVIDAQDYKGAYTVWVKDFAGTMSDVKVIDVQMDVTTPYVNVEFTSSAVNYLIEMLTFGFFKEDPEMKISATDPTNNDCQSGVAEICYKLTSTKHAFNGLEQPEVIENTVKINTAESKEEVYTVSIEAPFYGTVEVWTVDYAGNESARVINVIDSEQKTIDHIVVDDTAPMINVSYSPVDEQTTPFRYTNENFVDVPSFQEATSVYCGGEVQATITVIEDNFYKENITIKAMLEGKETDAYRVSEWTTVMNEETQKYEHKCIVTLTKAGDYLLEIECVDYAGNEAVFTADDQTVSSAKTYTSKRITIDKTAPKLVNIVYDNNKALNKVGDRSYYDAKRTATITIEEHNFRADEIALMVSGEDVTGTTVFRLDENGFAKEYSDLGKMRAKWTRKDSSDLYTLNVDYSADANYTFDITYVDPAGNAMADVPTEYFTVDTTAPTNLQVSYSASVLEDNAQKTGFYNAKVTVTITARDATSPIHHFLYSYVKGTGVSEVNAELIDEAIAAAQITQSEGSATATATFTIPKMVLDNRTQFNGIVEFTAFDRSENKTKMVDSQIIIVDNIAPLAEVTLNQPEATVNNVSYYGGEIQATVNITEANFYAEDVTVSVTKNGVAYPVHVSWNDASVNSHIGTFTLTDDGDYEFRVNYKDRSDNVMTEYVSSPLTIDTDIPTIQVSDVVHQSASSDEVYDFTITASDINIDPASFKAVLVGLTSVEGGAFERVEIPLESPVAVSDSTYVYTIGNLENDAIYTLNCSVSDYVGHNYDLIKLDDGKEYEKVQFSINRKGSTFMLGEKTQALIDGYYVQNVTNDIVIIEINTDELENYSVNLNGKKLTEGTDFTVKKDGSIGTWKKYTYTIKSDLFAEEGEYRVVVSSTDRVNNNAFSDVKDAAVTFVVDRTAPILTFSGMNANGRYQTNKQMVTIYPSDDGGALYSIIVQTVDNNGNVLTELMNLSGEKLLEALENGGGTLSFELDEGLYQNVRVICADCSQSEDGTVNVYDETFRNISVSTNAFMIFWANVTLRYLAIAAVVLLIGLIVFLLVWKNRKKNQKSKDI